jgi:hypothetical protein
MRKNSEKKSYKILYIIGSIALVFMLGFSSVNFAKDSRLLQAPVLSKVADNTAKEEKSTEDGYKTIKYKKSDSSSKSTSTKNKPTKTTKPTATPKPTPVPTVDP